MQALPDESFLDRPEYPDEAEHRQIAERLKERCAGENGETRTNAN